MSDKLAELKTLVKSAGGNYIFTYRVPVVEKGERIIKAFDVALSLDEEGKLYFHLDPDEPEAVKLCMDDHPENVDHLYNEATGVFVDYDFDNNRWV